LLRIYLDFDGVIAHSAVECITSAYNVWLHLQENPIQQNGTSRLEVERDNIIHLSIENRFLVVPPEHFFCLIQAVFEECQSKESETCTVSISKRFKKVCQNSPSSLMELFKLRFFKFREEKFNRQSDLDWITENPITPFATKLFDMLKPYQAEVLIVSRKNYLALAKWVSGSGFEVDKIYGNEDLVKFGGSKFNLISSLQGEFPCPRAVFVDDMAFEFDSAGWSDIGVETLEAGWGYNNLSDNTDVILENIRGFFK
jgi:hypothetical protein